VDKLGGPKGIANRILQARKEQRHQEGHDEGPIHILLQGNSFLRQIMEALMCGFQSQVTNMEVTVNGPGMSTADIEKRNKKQVPMDGLGTFIGLEEAQYVGYRSSALEYPLKSYF
jgi:hypothetical protein